MVYTSACLLPCPDASPRAQEQLLVSPVSFELIPGHLESVAVQLTNRSDATAIFKMKTTNPARFVVRPSHAVLPPHESQEIQISLRQDSTVEGREKFLLEYCFVAEPGNTLGDGGAEAESLSHFLHSNGESAPVHQQKLQCMVSSCPCSDWSLTLSATSRGASRTPDGSPRSGESIQDIIEDIEHASRPRAYLASAVRLAIWRWRLSHSSATVLAAIVVAAAIAFLLFID